MKNAFDESLVDWTWPRTESGSLNIYQQKLPKLKDKEKNIQTEYPRTMGQLQKVEHACSVNTRRRRQKRSTRRNIWSNNVWEFPKINKNAANHTCRSSENTKQETQKNLHLDISYSHCRKSKKREYLERGEKGTPCL